MWNLYSNITFISIRIKVPFNTDFSFADIGVTEEDLAEKVKDGEQVVVRAETSVREAQSALKLAKRTDAGATSAKLSQKELKDVVKIANSLANKANEANIVANQDDLVEAFAEEQDVYKIMASTIYNKPISEISKTMAKPIIKAIMKKNVLKNFFKIYRSSILNISYSLIH